MVTMLWIFLLIPRTNANFSQFSQKEDGFSIIKRPAWNIVWTSDILTSDLDGDGDLDVVTRARKILLASKQPEREIY